MYLYMMGQTVNTLKHAPFNSRLCYNFLVSALHTRFIILISQSERTTRYHVKKIGLNNVNCIKKKLYWTLLH